MGILNPTNYDQAICEGVTGKKVSSIKHQETNLKPLETKIEGRNIVKIKKMKK